MVTVAEVVAKHSAWCCLCGRRIVRGKHYVSPIPGGHWVHSQCAAELRRVREAEEAA